MYHIDIGGVYRCLVAGKLGGVSKLPLTRGVDGIEILAFYTSIFLLAATRNIGGYRPPNLHGVKQEVTPKCSYLGEKKR